MISVYVIYDAYSRSLEHGSNIGFVVVSLLESGHSDEAVGEIVEHGDGTIRKQQGAGGTAWVWPCIRKKSCWEV